MRYEKTTAYKNLFMAFFRDLRQSTMIRFASFALLMIFFFGLPAALVAAPVLKPVPFDILSDQESFTEEIWNRKDDILRGVEYSLSFLRTRQANKVYKRLEENGISRARVIWSLKRFRQLLENCSSSGIFHFYLSREFCLYRSVGWDGHGTIRFTGYFQPTYQASRLATEEYRYPIYRLPPDFKSWPKPHYARVALESYDGTGNFDGPLRGLELAWLKSRYEAFMIHVQGSAILEFEDGSQMPVGYAGNTNYRFVGFIKKCLVNKNKKISVEKFFRENPSELDRCLARNNRFIFFQENPTQDAIGSLGVPVIAECSIATDKKKMPAGALSLIRTPMPYFGPDGRLKLQKASRIVLDQDTGGAIKGPGRVDIFMGTGSEAGQKATSIFSKGELYYIVLNENYLQGFSRVDYLTLPNEPSSSGYYTPFGFEPIQKNTLDGTYPACQELAWNENKQSCFPYPWQYLSKLGEWRLNLFPEFVNRSLSSNFP